MRDMGVYEYLRTVVVLGLIIAQAAYIVLAPRYSHLLAEFDSVPYHEAIAVVVTFAITAVIGVIATEIYIRWHRWRAPN